jgi:hypothetical protein
MGLDQNNPITAHGELELGLVTPGRDLAGLGNNRRHAGMAHVPFEAHLRPGDRPAVGGMGEG